MAQRGGAVTSHLRLSRDRIWSDLIPRGAADLIISVEPLEALRYLDFLKPGGRVVTSSAPFVNIPDYPDKGALLARIKAVPGSVVVDSRYPGQAGRLRPGPEHRHARRGLPLLLRPGEDRLKECIRVLFEKRGDKILEANLKAFEAGRQAAA